MRTWNNLSSPKGFLFIGAPNVSSTKPGRRKDDYLASVLSKLEEAASISTENNLVPVILGDLIHRMEENSINLLSRLTEVFNKFPCTPLELGGNHGKNESESTPDDIEYLLNVAGTIRLLDDAWSSLPFVFSGKKVSLHIAPHGALLPYRLLREDGEFTILLTHHDLAFEDAYPGSAPLLAIKDCDMLVNGHMHKTAPSVKKGDTTMHCPGNIEPLSVDCIKHRPAVWEWRPEFGCDLLPHYLGHEYDCFNIVGRQVEAASAQEGVEALAPSRFASLIVEHSKADPKHPDEATGLCADLDLVIDQIKVTAATAELLRLLAADIQMSSEAK